MPDRPSFGVGLLSRQNVVYITAGGGEGDIFEGCPIGTVPLVLEPLFYVAPSGVVGGEGVFGRIKFFQKQGEQVSSVPNVHFRVKNFVVGGFFAGRHFGVHPVKGLLGNLHKPSCVGLGGDVGPKAALALDDGVHKAFLHPILLGAD